jgi:2-amino-4-hydroxy-6-hydroxymethyldihydropteridine diphosphokinase
MAHALVAIGSNLGDRARQLRQSVSGLARLPQTRVLSRSGWHETRPIGGPAGQELFLNAAALLSTSLTPEDLLEQLHRIEEQLGRTRFERWAARTVDLDLLLYDAVEVQSALMLPHPRMAFRRFVLEPAVEVAPWMLHPESGWTVQRLLHHLDIGGNQIAIAAVEESAAQAFIVELAERLRFALSDGSPNASLGERPTVIPAPWRADGRGKTLPKLIVALIPSTGIAASDRRKMLHLPPTGPVAWIDTDGADDRLDEAVAAAHAVWPELAMPT